MTLHYGDKGELVLSVQRRLHALGYYIPKFTGVMDNATIVSLINYQRSSGIFPNNGQVTDETLKSLKLKEDSE